MLPNLTIIVATYCLVRLLALVVRQWPSILESTPIAVTISALSGLAIALIVLCTIDTIGVGLSLGTAIDARH